MTQQGTFTVKDVYASTGNGPARIRDTENQYWKFWTNGRFGKEGIPFDSFQKGATYVVAYKATYDEKFGEQRTIEAIAREETNATAPASRPATNGNGHGNGHANGNGDRERAIYEQALLKCFIDAGKVELSADAITMAIVAIQTAYDRTR